MDHARRDRQRAERLSHDNTISRLPNFLPLSHLAGPLTCCQPGPVVSLVPLSAARSVYAAEPLHQANFLVIFPVFKCKEISGFKTLTRKAISFIFEIRDWRKILRK